MISVLSSIVSTSVKSLRVFPSLSSPSSLISVTSSVFPGLLAVAKTVFFTFVEYAAPEEIVYVAV